MPRYILPPKMPVKAIRISEKEFQKLKAVIEFETESEAKMIGYFMDKLSEPRNKHSPLDTRQFYVTQAVAALKQIQDPINQSILEGLVDNPKDKRH